MNSRALIGIDTGGTFIDLVYHGSDGSIGFHKQLADPRNLPASVLAGISALARAHGTDPRTLLAGTDLIAHGTTLATNAVLTRTGAPTALLTTAGLRDALEMRRGVKEEVFDLRYQAPTPLVGRQHRIGVDERIGYDGAVLKELRPDSALERLDRAVGKDGIRSVAICLMHAWINPDHEQALGALVREKWPGLDVVVSHGILPQVGFYDRVSTTVMTAYTAPLIRAYLHSLEQMLSEAGFAGRLFVITSSGGLMTPQDAIQQSARTVLSGPAAAPAVGVRLCKAAGHADAVVVDMGGTSFDASFVANSAPAHSSGGEIGGLRIAFPVTDVRSIPLGGGSIAWIDRGGLLRLGPRSAGADPGPACFGRGGSAPTITDADLVLGYLDPQQFSRSGLKIDAALAEAALDRELGRITGESAIASAIGVFRLAAAQMADAVQRAALDIGLDYRKAPLIVGGGAGPIHASAIGLELGADTLIVPAGAATLCAIGALYLQPRYDAVKSLFSRLSEISAADIGAICDGLAAQIASALHQRPDELQLTLAADLRYLGQEHLLTAEFSREDIDTKGVSSLREAFERLHRSRRGYILEGEEIEIMSLRVTAAWNVGLTTPSLGQAPILPAQPSRSQRAYDATTGTFREFAVHSWASLGPGAALEAPALIEMIGTTCVLTDPYRCVIDSQRNLVLTARPSINAI